MILWVLQHAALLVVWLIGHAPGWAWLVLLGLVGLALLRRAPLLAVLGLIGGFKAGRGLIRGSHASPMGGLIVVVVACAAIGHALGMGDGGPAPASTRPVLASVNGGPGTVFSYAQMAAALQATGMQPGNARIGAAVAEAESGGRSNALCDSCSGRPEFSVGPWQINLDAHPDVSESCAQDLSCAGAAVARLSQQGMDWSAWSTYTSGAYLAHLEAGS